MTTLNLILEQAKNHADNSSSNCMYYFADLENFTLIRFNAEKQKILCRFTYRQRRYKKWIPITAMKQRGERVYAHRVTLNRIVGAK